MWAKLWRFHFEKKSNLLAWNHLNWVSMTIGGNNQRRESALFPALFLVLEFKVSHTSPQNRTLQSLKRPIYTSHQVNCQWSCEFVHWSLSKFVSHGGSGVDGDGGTVDVHHWSPRSWGGTGFGQVWNRQLRMKRALLDIQKTTVKSTIPKWKCRLGRWE